MRRAVASNTSWIWKKRALRTAARMAAAGYSRLLSEVRTLAVSERTLAFHRHPVTRPRVRPVIPHRPVLRAAIVPEGDRIFGPAKPALEKRIFGVLIEIG